LKKLFLVTNYIITIYFTTNMIAGALAAAFYFGSVCFIAFMAHILWKDRAKHRKKIEERRVLITGGSEGIGLATAKECFRRGARVAILARNQKKLAAAAKDISPGDPSKVITISADISNASELELAIETGLKNARWQGLDILFCNAGITKPGLFSAIEEDEISKLINVNLLGTMYTVKACMPRLEKAANRLGSTGARIAFSNSLYGCMGMAQNSVYCASKYALRGFTESLDLELREKKIFITNLYFPDVDTPGFRSEAPLLAPAISEIQSEAGIFQTDEVARGITDAFEQGVSERSWGLDGWMLRNLTIGMRSATSLADSLAQICLLGLFRMIGMYYNDYFRRTIRKHGKLTDFRS